MALKLKQALLAGALASLFAAPAALAIGDAVEPPSATAPSYNPAEEYAKAVAALNAQKYKEAEQALERVTDAEPRNAEAWRMMGRANAAQNDLKGARRAYERALKLEPDNLAAHQGLGLALAGLKDAKAQAELDWLKARAQACGAGCPDASALKAAAAAVEQAIGGAPTASLPAGRLILAAEGDRSYMQAVSLINEHRYDEALAALAQAREAFGPHPDVLTYQGYAWRKKGDYARAESYYRQALAAAPGHRGATEYYGELKVERGDIAGARAMLAKLERACAYGCAEAEELRRWIDAGREPLS